MAKFYQTEEYNLEDSKTCFDKVQLAVLKHVLASQLCRMDDPRYGYMILSAIPTAEDDEWVMRASMCGGDFCLDGVTGEALAEQSIGAAVSFPDTDLHYTQMVSGSERLWGNAYFDEALSVLVLAASGGQLMLALQIAHTENGDEYAREHLLKAYAAATLVFQYMMPQDDILQSSCLTALSEIKQQYSDCMCYDDMMNDLRWIEGTFKREQQPEIHQWALWRQEHPEVKSFFMR